MKIRVPDYFVNFKCIADKCLDCCCIGWEIDIDDKTRTKYSQISGEIGHEIAEKTQHGCFTLAENGRCAFLDDKGLCRIICALGDEYLCDICREHPRYYGVGKDGIEGGLGLGCEEAARMILSLKELPSYTEINRHIPYSDDDEYADVNEYFRELLFNNVFTGKIEEVTGAFAEYAALSDEVAFDISTTEKKVDIPKLTITPIKNERLEKLYTGFFKILSECELLNDNARKLIERASSIRISDALKVADKTRGIFYYFTHRYVREGVLDISLGQRILFALVSALAISALSLVNPADDSIIRSAVFYSKNIEYSTDNVDMILDRLSDFL